MSAATAAVFVKNCAKIRGKLAGNWRHLRNKGEDGEVRVGSAMKGRERLRGPASARSLAAGEGWGRGFFLSLLLLKRGFAVLLGGGGGGAKLLLSPAMVTGSRCCQEMLIEGQILDNSLHHRSRRRLQPPAERRWRRPVTLRGRRPVPQPSPLLSPAAV